MYSLIQVFFVPARQVDGKTRLGVFASQAIKVGMPLTYNYRYFKLTLNKPQCCPFFLQHQN